MSIFRKLTGKGDGKDKESSDGVPGKAFNPDAGAKLNPSAGKGANEQGARTAGPLKPMGTGAKPGGSGNGKDLPFTGEEAGGKIKPGDRLPELEVSQETDMLQLLSDQAGLRYVRLADYPKASITPELLHAIPSELARSWKVFPIELRAADATITVAISDPLNVRVVDDLRLFLQSDKVRNIEAVVANEEEIVDYINLFYGVGDQTLDEMVEMFEAEDSSTALGGRAEGTLDLSDLDKIQQEEPIIRFCNLLLLQAVKERASDIHIEPFQNVLRIRYRVDGVLREIPTPPKSWQLGILSRMKVMANIDIAETRRPQDGRIKLMIDGRDIDCRLSTLPVVHGECLVMRLLDKTMMQVGVQQIGMTPEVLDQFMKIVQRPNGIMLVTGPTGSGKTTTLYAALNEINEPTEKIITTEDPVEYQMDGLVQVNINTNAGLTFARCLRAILRQDPDVILVGEIRDAETAQIAIQASLTGHLVFSTLHTNSAAATISRLVDMGIEPFLITSTLAGVIAQRLVRMTCPRCKAPYRPAPDELAEFGTTVDEVADITFMKGTGCNECGQTGYKGRIGIFELLTITEEVMNLILEHATTDELHATALSQGMKTMRQDGWLKICLGVTTFEEVMHHTPREAPELIEKEMKSVIEKSAHAAAPADREAAPAVSMSSIQGGQIGLPSIEDLEAAARARDSGDGGRA